MKFLPYFWLFVTIFSSISSAHPHPHPHEAAAFTGSSSVNGSSPMPQKRQSCIALYLAQPRPHDPATILRKCLQSDCSTFTWFNRRFSSVLFNVGGTFISDPYNSAKALEVIKDFHEMACPSAGQYKRCAINAIRDATQSQSGGGGDHYASLVDFKIFKNNIPLTFELVPNTAFCEAGHESRRHFYEFLNQGGQQCLSNQTEFLDPVAACIFGPFFKNDPGKYFNIPSFQILQKIHTCAPPLIQKCDGGQNLEKIFKQFILPELDKAYGSLWNGFSD